MTKHIMVDEATRSMLDTAIELTKKAARTPEVLDTADRTGHPVHVNINVCGYVVEYIDGEIIVYRNGVFVEEHNS